MPRKHAFDPIAPTTLPGEPTDPKIRTEDEEREHEEPDADHDPAELAAQHQVGAARAQEPGDDDEDHRHDRSLGPDVVGSSGSPRPSKTISSRPSTMAYTPVSKTVAEAGMSSPRLRWSL